MSSRDLDDTDLPEHYAAKMRPAPRVPQRTPIDPQLDLFPESLTEPREGGSAAPGYTSTGTIDESATEMVPVPFVGYLRIPRCVV